VGIKTIIEDDEMLMFDRRRALLARVKKMHNRLYSIMLTPASPVCLLAKEGDMAWRWHSRLGHLHFRTMYELGAKDMVHGMPNVERIEQVCEGCTLGKQHRTTFPRATSFIAAERLELTHGDLCGPISPVTPGGNIYFLLVVDDCTRYMWLEVLRSKDEALKFFKKISALEENEKGLKMKAFRTDRGGEFNSKEFTDFCSEKGIKRHTTSPYSPQQNGVVERRNQTIVEMARCMLKSMKMPSVFWAEAVQCMF
jgi:hypothetical protein